MENKHNHYFKADNAERRLWQNPEAILATIGLKPALTLVDIGCGGGFFALPAARITRGRGMVYGIDINADYLRELNELAVKEKLDNLILTVGKAEEVIVCERCADIVFFGLVLHDFEDAVKVIRNANRMLKPGGHLFNLDWKKERTDRGPSFKKRFSQEYAAGLIEAAGFAIENIKTSGRYHYLISALKLPER
ncbi:MAG: methyltransferase domain-containing protein [Dehalococcoidia bacterium]|nr:MAG: methyltransferase domain-containing protein [Dehalococcoidia bacterium]